MYCPNCGKKFNTDNQNFCTNCGYKLDSNKLNIEHSDKNSNSNDTEQKLIENSSNSDIPKKNNNTINILKILLICFVITLLVLLLVSFVFNVVPNLNTNVQDLWKPKAANCEATNTKDLVLQIFRDNNEYYNAIDPLSIASIELEYPAVTSYDKELDKYSCTGTIIMKSNENGFIPTLYDYNNKYYKKINNNWYNYETLEKFTTYEVQNKYNTQISENNLLVQSKEINEEFSCDIACGRIPNEKYQKEKEEQKKKQEIIQKENELAAEEERKKIQRIYNTPSAQKTIIENHNSNHNYYHNENASNYNYNQNTKNNSLKEEAENELF